MNLTASSNTFWAKIFMAGDLAVIKQACREHCLAIGLCVTIEQADYIYTAGEEKGVIIGLINYPRFPVESQEEVTKKAEELATKLADRACQRSFSIMTPEKTFWFTRESYPEITAKT